MMLIRQLPAPSMSIPLSSISLPSLPLFFPSSSSLLLSLLASVVLLSFIRAALLYLKTNIPKQPPKQAQVEQAKTEPASGEQQQQQRRSSWAWGILTWESLPAVSLTLPVSLTVVDNNSKGRGVGLQEKRNQSWQQSSSTRRSGPAFESPLPAIYQSDVPVSMAKMIMSRHTYRKPSNRPPARPLLPSSSPSHLPAPHPVSSPSSPPLRRTPSMV